MKEWEMSIRKVELSCFMRAEMSRLRQGGKKDPSLFPINLDSDTISVTGEETGAPRCLLNPEHSLSAINAPATQSTCHLQSPQDYHSICFFIDCHSTLIMWLIKTKRHRPSTYARPPRATWWMRQLISRTRTIVDVLYSSSLPSTQALGAHTYYISCTLSSHQEKLLFSFFPLNFLFFFFFLNLIFRVNWELVISFVFQGWALKCKTSICYRFSGLHVWLSKRFFVFFVSEWEIKEK